jgi:hypothetical protein
LARRDGAGQHAVRIGFQGNLGPHGNGALATVGLDQQMSFEGFIAGAQMTSANLDMDDDITIALEKPLRIAGGVAERQPFAVRADRAVQEPLAQVGEMQLKTAVGADRHDAEAYSARLSAKLGRVKNLRGNFRQETVQAAVSVRKAGRFLGGQGKIGTADAREKAGEKALLEEVDCTRPVLLAGHGELIEVAARLAGRKDKLAWKRLHSRRDFSAVRGVFPQNHAVEIAVNCFGRVGVRTLAAKLGHGLMKEKGKKEKGKNQDADYSLILFPFSFFLFP